MTSVDWSRYPALLTAKHVAEIYNRKIGGVRKGWQLRSSKLPTPCQARPYKVRRADCQRHFERMSA